MPEATPGNILVSKYGGCSDRCVLESSIPAGVILTSTLGWLIEAAIDPPPAFGWDDGRRHHRFQNLLIQIFSAQIDQRVSNCGRN